MAAAVPAIVSVASALYSGYQQNKARQKQDELMKNEQKIQDQEVHPASKEFLGQSQQAFGPALSYYSSMLNNPREATAPEQNRVNSLYAGSATAARNMHPRGGYGPSTAENVRSQQRQANESIIQNARPMAAGSLANMGGALGQLGMQGYGLGTGILGNVFNQGLQARQQAFQTGQAAGGAFFNAYNQYLMNRANSTTDQSGGGLYGGASGASGTNTNTSGAGSWGLM